jgi:hypothetical protein
MSDDQGLPLWPFLIVDWWSGKGRSRDAAGAGPGQAREILERFATRAFRRPARPPRLDRLVALVESERRRAKPPRPP